MNRAALPATIAGAASADADAAVADDGLAEIRALLDQVTDPEIPVITIRQLGVLRDVRRAADGSVEVVITPTYSGCPAMGQIEDDVKHVLAAQGVVARVVTQLAPAWSTDWISERGRQRLAEFGIAPPHRGAGTGASVIRFATKQIAKYEDPPVVCPHCGSKNTTETSHFGSTACKALYRCLDCMEPFDLFKPH